MDFSRQEKKKKKRFKLFEHFLNLVIFCILSVSLEILHASSVLKHCPFSSFVLDAVGGGAQGKFLLDNTHFNMK